MESRYTIEIFVLENGKKPFEQWFEKLKDVHVRNRVRSRLERLTFGNFGDFKTLGGGISELRFDIAGGLRVYFTIDGNTVVILLNGGNKSSQSRDIEQARRYCHEYTQRKTH